VQFSTAVTAELIGVTSDQQSSSEGSRYHPDAQIGVGYQFPRPAYPPAGRLTMPRSKYAVLTLRDRWYTHSVEVILRESAEPAAALLRR